MIKLKNHNIRVFMIIIIHLKYIKKVNIIILDIIELFLLKQICIFGE